MRLPERFPPDDPREWLNRAREQSRAGTEPQFQTPIWKTCALKLSKAAEKAIKAVLIRREALSSRTFTTYRNSCR